MFRGRRTGVLFVTAMLIVAGGASAAADDVIAHVTPAEQQDDKSYLPPWMRPQGDTRTALADGAFTPGAELTAPNPDAKIKMPGEKPQQKRRRSSFDWLFGR